MNKLCELEGARRRIGHGRTPYRRWLVLAAILFAPGAWAWNDTGHEIAALIAYDRMAPVLRASMGQLVRSHPRFQEDFASRLPKSLRNASAAEQDRWFFAYASTWPDVARRFDNVRRGSAREALIARYNHSTWHYINLPTYLQKSDRKRLAVRAPSMTWSTGSDNTRLNAVQALDMLTTNWCAAGDAERALALAWISHLVADLHQPLHATALFAYPTFIRGDRGGNDIEVTGSTRLHAENLHALWDGALGSDSTFKQISARARDYDRRAGLSTEHGGDPSSHFPTWARQARELAASDAYTPEVRAGVASASGAPSSVAISDAYRVSMQAVAVHQIAAAGRRIASVLTALSNESAGATTCSQQSD